MTAGFAIETPRLILRGWREEDARPFQRICTDPDVMEHLGPPLTLREAEQAVVRQNAFLDSAGYCFWAMEHKDSSALMGFCGVKPGAVNTPIENRPEIGWRMGRNWWGAGYAREAAQASLDWMWANTGVDSVWAITTPANVRSWGLMERLGMTRHHELDFRSEEHTSELQSH